MPNVETIIQGNNNSKLQKDTAVTATQTRSCNCRRKEDCPLKGECLRSNVIYKAEVMCDGNTETYTGLTSNTFKARYSNHKSTFNDPQKRLSTELSKHVWSLKDRKKDFVINWSILQNAKPYSNISKRCDLCITEKFIITCKPSLASLNKRYELVAKCRHQNRFLIGNVT